LPGSRHIYALGADKERSMENPEEGTRESGAETPPVPEEAPTPAVVDPPVENPPAEEPPAAPAAPAVDTSGEAESLSRLNALLDSAEVPAGSIEQRMAGLTRMATDGRRFRESVIEDLLKQGARANGKGFNADVYRKLAASSDLDAIEALRDDFKRAADAKFPGGRLTEDEAPPEERKSSPKHVTPDAAYAGE
jgi:hypothetical protein